MLVPVRLVNNIAADQYSLSALSYPKLGESYPCPRESETKPGNIPFGVLYPTSESITAPTLSIGCEKGNHQAT